MTNSVLCDSNIYRKLRGKSLSEIRAAEAVNGFIPYAPQIAVLELAAHLSDPTDPFREKAFASLQSLALHVAGREIDGDILYRVAGGTNRLLAHAVFDTMPEGLSNDSIALPDLLGAIAELASTAELTPLQSDLTDLTDFVAGQEQDFVSHLWDTAVHGIIPEADTWQAIHQNPTYRSQVQAWATSDAALDTLAFGLAASVQLLYPEADRPELTNQHIAIVRNGFATGLHFTNELLRRILQDGLDMTKQKRGNFLWDRELSYSVGPRQRLGGLPILLVTEDQFIHDAARLAGTTAQVTKLAGYRQLLGLKAG